MAPPKTTIPKVTDIRLTELAAALRQEAAALGFDPVGYAAVPGGLNEDMDMPPLESAEGGPNSPGHEGAAQQHTSSGALTEGNGEGWPGWPIPGAAP